MKMTTLAVLFFSVLFPALHLQGKEPSPLIIHEWGTFTVLQDDQGKPVPGVNINEETLPSFVHRLNNNLAADSHELSAVLNLPPYQPRRSKGIARLYPLAIMRMETPILYFHLPEGQSDPVELSLKVSFNSGWISEWYPAAEVSAPGFTAKRPFSGDIAADTVGVIEWKNVRVGGEPKPFPETDSHVWLAPRDVKSAAVRVGDESEQYLFYRGVANRESPLRVRRSEDGKSLNLHHHPEQPPHAYSHLWLADIRPDGTTAFRSLGAAVGKLDETLLTTPAQFASNAWTLSNRDKLRREMKVAVVEQGLFDDEADALLNTWEASYFKSPGMRLFYLLPQAWTDHVLPIETSVPAEFTRVMIGRIELVTPEQKERLNELATIDIVGPTWFDKQTENWTPEQKKQRIASMARGDSDLQDFEIKTPREYQLYMALGRFRDALLLDEIAHHPKKINLLRFKQAYGIHYFRHRATAQ